MYLTVAVILNSKKGLLNRRMGKHPYRGFDFIKYVYRFMRFKDKSDGKDVNELV